MTDLEFYHGSISVFDEIDLAESKSYKDFGRGFYITRSREQARKLALSRKKNMINLQKIEIRRGKRKKLDNVCAYVYEMSVLPDIFKESNSYGLSVKIFHSADVEWVRFVLAHRQSSYNLHSFDIVVGPTADSETDNLIEEYVRVYGDSLYNNEEALNMLVEELHPERLTTQYCFSTYNAIGYIKHKKYWRKSV